MHGGWLWFSMGLSSITLMAVVSSQTLSGGECSLLPLLAICCRLATFAASVRRRSASIKGTSINNPFQPPKNTDVSSDYLSPYEEIRAEHRAHEFAIKLVGWLLLLGAVVNVGLVVSAANAMNSGVQVPYVEYTMHVAITLWLVVVSIGMICLTPWSRWMGLVFAIGNSGFLFLDQEHLGLLVWWGLAINVYIFRLMILPQSSMVFSAAYRDIIRQTRHMKYAPARFLALLALIAISVILGVTVFGG